MIFPDYPEGVTPLELLRDLRSVVRDVKLRVRVMVLYRAAEAGGKLTVDEVQWVRAEARSRRAKIQEQHEARDRMPMTDLRVRVGAEKLSSLQRAAVRATATRNLAKLAEAEAEVVAAQEASEDLGI